jgi:hypothetical protein
MSIDERANDAKEEALQNLPVRPAADADRVKGGASITPPPGGPVPIPFPNIKPGVIRSLEPCL